MEDQEQKLKRQIEGALSEGPDSLLPATWEAVYKASGKHYLAYITRGDDLMMGWESEEQAWAEVMKDARKALQRQKETIRQYSGKQASKRETAEEDGEDPTAKHLSERTKVRAQALSELYAFRTGEDVPTRAMRVKLRAGGLPVDDDIRQVIHMEV